MNLARMTMLSICNEMDVKGTMSGKEYVWQNNGRPRDLLGWTLQRMGYTASGLHGCITPEGEKLYRCYGHLCKLLELPHWCGIIHEIDRHTSTNESIKQKIELAFQQHPIAS